MNIPCCQIWPGGDRGDVKVTGRQGEDPGGGEEAGGGGGELPGLGEEREAVTAGRRTVK